MFGSCRQSIEYIFVKAYWVDWDFGGRRFMVVFSVVCGYVHSPRTRPLVL